jgi:hypothetical protein
LFEFARGESLIGMRAVFRIAASLLPVKAARGIGAAT